MACGDFQQIRLADYLRVDFTDTDPDDDPFDLSDAIEVGQFKLLTVTVLVTKASLAGGGTGIAMGAKTAAINNDTYYGGTNESGVTITSVTSEPQVFVGTFEVLSRFWLPEFKVEGSPSGASQLSCTIDIVAR